MFHSKYLSWYRHVHGFLEEIGQGVQHIASRVDDIIAFVQEANDRRKVFGEVSAHCDRRVSTFHHVISSYLLNHTYYVYYFLGLHIPKYSPQLLRCLDEGHATQRY
jgi:hypothetical protein